MTHDEAKDYWKEYQNIKGHADILASWWIGFNTNADNLPVLAEAGHKTCKFVADCLAIYLDCPEENGLKERLTDGMNKKLYLERYIRGKEKKV
jgi:hypothetical protein